MPSRCWLACLSAGPCISRVSAISQSTSLLYRVTFDVDTIRTRLREVAFLNSTATILFETRGVPTSSGSAGGSSNGAGGNGASGNGAPSSNGSGASAGNVETFHFSGGIAEFVAYNNRVRMPMHDPMYVSQLVSTLWWSLALRRNPTCDAASGV